MIYSIHTMELRLTPDTKEFNRILSDSFQKAKKDKHRLGQSTLYKNNVKVDNAFGSKGIKIEYHDDKYKKKIKFIVNPSKLLGGDDLRLWKPNKDNIKRLLVILDGYIDEYFDSKYSLNDFMLTRADFTVNLDVNKRENVSAYIKVLYNIGKVKGFSPKYTKYDEHINKDFSFDLEGNSNGIEFSVYDKEAESERKKAQGILRVEVRLKKQMAISRYTEETKTAKQIGDLAKNSREIFLDTFRHIVPCGDYYQKSKAVNIIAESNYSQKMKEKMIRLMELIPKKKSFYLALKEMNDRGLDKVLRNFADINLSPVTLSKRQTTKHLQSLYKYL